MDKKRKEKLERNGCRVVSVKEFLNLSDAEERYIELKLALAKIFHSQRKKKRLTQKRVSQILHTSQSRVAKIEKGDPSVSLDLLFKSVFSLDVSPKELSEAIR